MKRPIYSIETYVCKRTNLLTKEDDLFEFTVKIYHAESSTDFILEFSPFYSFMYHFLFKSKQSLLNAKKSKITAYLEARNSRDNRFLYYSTFFELRSVTYFYE